eukprot:GHVH01004771.1.p1 GENE.GHVH01004771.1~~GHVH01004771.1.p1  ORF type:complete len:179 (-),score=27.46 GHVH01004771.1:10-546(-)
MKLPGYTSSSSLWSLRPIDQSLCKQYVSWFQDDELRYLLSTDELDEKQVAGLIDDWTSDDDKFNFAIYADDRPIGDVGLFTQDHHETEFGDLLPEWSTKRIWEWSFMIADVEYRRKGYMKQILPKVTEIALDHLDVGVLIAKVKQDGNAVNLLLALNYIQLPDNLWGEHVFYKLALCE